MQVRKQDLSQWMVCTDILFQVTVDLSLAAAANARRHFEKRKKHALKEQKTYEANASAVKAAEAKVQVCLQYNEWLVLFVLTVESFRPSSEKRNLMPRCISCVRCTGLRGSIGLLRPRTILLSVEEMLNRMSCS